jgi:hypothetical protein
MVPLDANAGSRRWYGWQTAIPDAVAAGCGFAIPISATSGSRRSLALYSLALYLTPAFVHLAQDEEGCNTVGGRLCR